MKKIYKTLAAVMMTAGVLSVAVESRAEVSAPVSVFGGTNAGETNNYRIPALANDGNGTLIAFTDDRGDKDGADIGVNGSSVRVLYKISKDNGATWSKSSFLVPAAFNHQHGDVAVTYDQDKGRFVVLFVGDQSWQTGKRGTIWATYSTNADYTAWSEPKDVTSQFVPNTSYRGFASSGTMMYKDKAVYVVLCKSSYTTSSLFRKYYISNVLFKSTDGGKNWTQVSGEIEGGDESHVVATDEGLVLSRRLNGNGTGYKYRNFWRSNDEGKTFTALGATIDESGCNGDLLVYKDDNTEWLIQSLNLNRSGDSRPLVIYASSNGGSSWVETKTIDNGEYSCLTKLKDGKIGLLYEQYDGTHYSTYFRTMDLKDVTPASTNIFEGYLNTNQKGYLTIAKTDAETLAKVSEDQEFTVTARVLCNVFETGNTKVDRGVMGTRAKWTQKEGLLNLTHYYINGFEIYGGNTNNPFGINVSVSQGSYATTFDGAPFVLANQPYSKFYKEDKDKWTHVTLVFNPKEGYCYSYINGKKYEEQGNTNYSGNSAGKGVQYNPNDPNNSPAKGKGIDVYDVLAIGARLNGSTPNEGQIWSGGIDDVRFYNKALDEKEIAADIKSGFPLFTGENMRGAFDFSAKEGNTMSDITAKGINATTHTIEGYLFPETDQNATTVNVTVVDREGNVLEYEKVPYVLYRYENGSLAPKATGAKASVNTDFMITASNYLDDRSLYAIYVNGKEIDPFDFSITDFVDLGKDFTGGYTGGYFKSAKAVNEVKVVYDYFDASAFGFKLVGENHYDYWGNHIVHPYEFMFEKDGDGEYILEVDTENPVFQIEYFDTNKDKRQTTNCLTGVFHVEEVFEAAKAEAKAVAAPRAFYAHEVERLEMGHTSVQMFSGYKFKKALQNADNQNPVINFTTNEPKAPFTTSVGFQKPVFHLIFTPTERSLWVEFQQGGGTTGAESIVADSNDAPVEIYTLQGVRVSQDNLTPGFYIRRQGRTATKILVR